MKTKINIHHYQRNEGHSKTIHSDIFLSARWSSKDLMLYLTVSNINLFHCLRLQQWLSLNAHFILSQRFLAQQGEASKLLASPTTSTAVKVVQLQDISIH